MANQRVTDRNAITTAIDLGVIHFIDTSDNTDNVAGTSFKITKEDFLKENTAAILLNTAKVGFTDDLVAASPSVVLNTSKVGFTDALVDANPAVVLNTAKVGISTVQATAITDNATAITTKLGKSGSTIAVSEVDVLTEAAYAALGTKVATTLYFTTA